MCVATIELIIQGRWKGRTMARVPCAARIMSRTCTRPIAHPVATPFVSPVYGASGERNGAVPSAGASPSAVPTPHKPLQRCIICSTKLSAVPNLSIRADVTFDTATRAPELDRSVPARSEAEVMPLCGFVPCVRGWLQPDQSTCLRPLLKMPVAGVLGSGAIPHCHGI